MHFAVAPPAEPVEKARFLGAEIRIGDADLRDPESASPFRDVACESFDIDDFGSASHHQRNHFCFLAAIMTSTIIEGGRCFLADAAATLSAGGRLAAGLRGGMVVALSGELGAGKTTLVRGMLRGLGWDGSVKSPSYALVEHYFVSSLYFYHFDFYRFGDPDEWRHTGFAEYFRPDSICVIEWPERIGAWLPEVDLALRLEPACAGRTLTLHASSAAGKACLEAFNAGAD